VSALSGGGPATAGARGRELPAATVSQLPLYLRSLIDLAERGVETVSSSELAVDAGVTPAKLRKDLSHLGSYGVRGVGYDVDYLRQEIEDALGLSHDWPVVIVGMGNLGQALARYGGFGARGFRVVGMVDVNPAVVGLAIGELTVRHADALEEIVLAGDVAIAVLTAPVASAQRLADRLVAAGVTSILNFAPLTLEVPPTVDVRQVDLGVELQILSFHEQRKALRPNRPGVDCPPGADSDTETTAVAG
jgi:redox-sensing transcriptional repressor